MDQVEEMGKRLLAEYEDRLKDQVQDVKPYRDQDAPQEIAIPSNYHLETVDPDKIERQVRHVLDDLAGKGKFIMVGPKHLTMLCTDTRNIKSPGGKLLLTFTHGSSIVDLKSYIWVACWYRPTA